MSEVFADKDYFLDSEGNVTTDSTKAANWLAKKDGVISKEVQDKYGIPSADKGSKVAQAEEEDEKSDAPKANKKANPSKNKGVKNK